MQELFNLCKTIINLCKVQNITNYHFQHNIENIILKYETNHQFDYFANISSKYLQQQEWKSTITARKQRKIKEKITIHSELSMQNQNIYKDGNTSNFRSKLANSNSLP